MFGGINNIYMGGYKYSAHCTNISAHKIYFRASSFICGEYFLDRTAIFKWLGETMAKSARGNRSDRSTCSREEDRGRWWYERKKHSDSNNRIDPKSLKGDQQSGGAAPTVRDFSPKHLMAEFHILEAASTSASVPKVKPPPKTSKIPSQFFYGPSDDGTDENLLIFLHGLGRLDGLK